MQRPLVTLAVLESLFKNKKTSNWDLLVPFTMNLILKMKLDDVCNDKLPKICEEFEKVYGLKVPIIVMTKVIRSAQNSRLIIPQQMGTSWKINKSEIEALGFDAKISEHEAKWANIINEFITFCADRGRTISDAQAQEMFLGFLKRNDVSLFLGPSGESVFSPNIKASNDIYIVSKFIEHLNAAKDQESLGFITDFALGHMLAGTILHWDRFAKLDHLSGLNVYIDTPIILQMLGIADPAQYEAAWELIRLLQDRGATTLVFAHTIAEVTFLLEGTKVWIDNPQFRPSRATRSALYVVDNQLSELDVQLKIDKLNRLLSDNNVHIRSVPSFKDDVQHMCDESVMTEYINNEYGLDPSSSSYFDMKETILRDVKSISAIIRLRKGHTSHRLSESRYIFVSTNRALVRSIRRFEIDTNDLRPNQITSCITDELIALIAWSIDPVAGKPLAVKRVVAQAIAATQPSSELIRLIEETLSKRIQQNTYDHDEYIALNFDPNFRKMVVECADNDPNKYALCDISEVIKQYQLQHAEPVLKENEILREQSSDLKVTNEHLQDNILKASKLFALLVSCVAAIAIFYLFYHVKIQTPLYLWLTHDDRPELIASIARNVSKFGIDVLLFTGLSGWALVPRLYKYVYSWTTRVLNLTPDAN